MDCRKCRKRKAGHMGMTVISATVPDENIENRFFVIHQKGINVLGAIRECVGEWLNTPEGKAAWEDTNHDFNWGDLALHDIPWRYGIAEVEAIEGEDNTIEVLHDEVFRPTRE